MGPQASLTRRPSTLFRFVVGLMTALTLGMGLVAPPSARAQAASVDELTVEPGFSATDADTLRLYWAFFNRDPDLPGARYWIGEVDRGASLDVIASSFAVSDEFSLRYGATDDRAFLEIVYQNVLGRDADRAGFDYWLGQMGGGLSRGGVVRWMAANDEFVARHPYPDGTARVERVVDGDTLVLTDGRRVRLAQVDGPETDQCFGSEATAELRRLTADRVVHLRRPSTAPVTDQYGRTVAELLVEGPSGLVSVNESLVRTGHAEYYQQFASEDPDLAIRLAQAEVAARQDGVGLWSRCAEGTQPTTPTGPPNTGTGCHPAYTPCIPPPEPDLDCADIGHQVAVNHAYGDPHNLDGNDDGQGCEAYG